MKERWLSGSSFEVRLRARKVSASLLYFPHQSQPRVLRFDSPPLAASHSRPLTRTGITLIEILISMFVLLFGLMGVAAIFPVASHYLTQGDQKDRSDALAANAFAEIKARGLMRPEFGIC